MFQGALDVAKTSMSKVIDRLRRAVMAGGETDVTDGELLEYFVRRHDEAAVAALVRRHGPMVWSVSRRILGNHHDAEDAFQATFLVLVRKAASVRPREMLAAWLHGVARQTALKARATTVRRQAREKQGTAMPEPEARRQPESSSDLQHLLDLEIARLNDKYRVAILLCDLEGKSRQDAARAPADRSIADLDTLWADLAKDGRVAHQAIAALIAAKGAPAYLARGAPEGKVTRQSQVYLRQLERKQ